MLYIKLQASSSSKVRQLRRLPRWAIGVAEILRQGPYFSTDNLQLKVVLLFHASPAILMHSRRIMWWALSEAQFDFTCNLISKSLDTSNRVIMGGDLASELTASRGTVPGCPGRLFHHTTRQFYFAFWDSVRIVVSVPVRAMLREDRISAYKRLLRLESHPSRSKEGHTGFENSRKEQCLQGHVRRTASLSNILRGCSGWTRTKFRELCRTSKLGLNRKLVSKPHSYE